jgi:type II secretory pathway pseudopilin PulG
MIDRIQRQACSCRDRRRLRGRFTLFELVLVLALLALLLGRAAPVLRGFLRGRAAVEEARCLLAYSRHAASEAISRGESWVLWVDVSEGTYGVEARSGFAEHRLGPPGRVLPDTVTVSVVADGADRQDSFEIVWYPDGVMDSDGLDAIVVADAGNKSDSISLIPDEAHTSLIVDHSQSDDGR